MASWEGVVSAVRLGVLVGGAGVRLDRLRLLVACSCPFCICCWFFFSSC